MTSAKPVRRARGAAAKPPLRAGASGTREPWRASASNLPSAPRPRNPPQAFPRGGLPRLLLNCHPERSGGRAAQSKDLGNMAQIALSGAPRQLSRRESQGGGCFAARLPYAAPHPSAAKPLTDEGNPRRCRATYPSIYSKTIAKLQIMRYNIQNLYVFQGMINR